MRYFIAIVLIVLAGCAGLVEKLPPAPTIAEIIQMAKTGESADIIIQRMQESQAVYQLPASELAKLRDQGVPDKVIDFMQQSYIEAVRYYEWLRVRDAYLYQPFVGPPFRPYYFGRYPYGWW
jgi:hypothetical protein